LCKAAHRVYRPGPNREWLKTKCSAVGKFVITGFRDLTPGEIEASRPLMKFLSCYHAYLCQLWPEPSICAAESMK